MRRVVRTFILVFACAFAGCEKLQNATQEGVGKNQGAIGDKFAQEYEEWKARAVQEFPDLGKAGTPMNARFIEAAKELSDRNGEELKYPNWPYLLAVKVNAALAAATKQGVKGVAKSGEPSHIRTLSEIGRIYTVAELKALAMLPGAASVVGRVTKFDEIGLPPGVLSVVLDDALRCELTLIESYPGESLSWQRSGSSISLLRQGVRGGGATALSLSMGQVLRVEGVFTQKRGAAVLVGSLRRD